MDHAWLDSLSEDWVSQPGSEASPPPGQSVRSATKNGTNSSNSKASGSKIPRFDGGSRKLPSATHDNSNILSERSQNDINIPVASLRSPSKLSQEIKSSARGRLASRSVSASSIGSVVHNTVQHKSQSASPAKEKGHTPEWRRRLLRGNLPYGDQRDLFTSAGTGLEDMFRPPSAPRSTTGEQSDEDQQLRHESTMPSSPPPYDQGNSTFDIHVDESVVQALPGEALQAKPRSMKYTMMDEIPEEHDQTSFNAVDDEVNGQAATAQERSEFSQTSLYQHDQQPDESRKVSGQSVVRNEDFSPILISRHNSQDGKVSFAPMDLAPDELKKRLEKLRRNQMVLASGDFSKLGDGATNPEAKSYNIENTEDYEKLGGFINFRRGGRSADGSFRHRPLSPPIGNDTSEMLPEESLQASTPKQFPTLRINDPVDDIEHLLSQSPSLPRAPHPSPEKRAQQGQGSSGSPLKLFGPYDTFTNQTLLRRISQFEEQNSSQASNGNTLGSDIDEHVSEMLSTKMPATQGHRTRHGDVPSSRSVSQFGAGHLDGYPFDEDFSYNSNDNSEHDKENQGPEDYSMQSQAPLFHYQHTSLSQDEDVLRVQRRRQRSTTATSSQWATGQHSRHSSGINSHARMSSRGGPEILATPQKRDSGSESKRPRTSPSKDPTPKRRRTLHKSDIAYEVDDAAIDSVQLTHQQMQSIIGRKRKDARNGDVQQLADASVLAQRQILRPRTPTPSQRLSIQREDYPFGDDDVIDTNDGEARVQAEEIFIRSTAVTVETDRKPSIKTEDFINEANKIMEMIRGRGGLQSGLASVEESEAENAGQQANAEDVEDSFQESTKEPFSRPPSREGRPATWMSNRQEDPELASRLKKYEERSDMGDIITSSIRSLGLAQGALRGVNPEASQQRQASIFHHGAKLSLDDSDVVSDPPNIRITDSRQRKDGVPDGPLSVGDRFPSNGSSESGASTARSIPTTSSRSSETRKTIAPESVSHLIPDQVGNMFLDRDRNIWVKKKAESPNRHRTTNILPSEGSEGDPFAEIPDLSVDATREMQNLNLPTARKVNVSPEDESPDVSRASPFKSTKTTVVKETAIITTTESIQDRPTRLTDNAAQQRSPSKIMRKFAETDDEDVEHEITIHEDRLNSPSPKRRNLTISFSSPIASIIQDAVRGDFDSQEEDPSLEEPFVGESLSQRGRRTVSIKSSIKNETTRSRSGSRRPSRHHSVRSQVFMPRPVSRIDEQDEDSRLESVSRNTREISVVADNSALGSVVSEQRQTSLSLIVTTPARPSPHPRLENAHIIGQYVGTLSLTPMSDFTAQHDQSYGLEVSYVVGDNHLITGEGSKKTMSLTVRDLVDRLSEVEPFEPYWEDMKELDIRNKRLSSLHMLNEFCGSLVRVDASDNAIRNLDGVPATVREFKITNNHISDLTSWGHLMNLQYIDVSNNDIKSLSVFRDMVHLRGLVADNNNLTSLDGILYHDGLQTLRARGNMIEAVDFDATALQRLTELDLEGNKITKLENLDQLASLQVLNLKGNQLEDLLLGSAQPMWSLRRLTLTDNNFSTLDVKLMPSLKLLHADRNYITKLTGLSKVRRLDSLSLREQRGSTALDMSFLQSAYEVRKLFLSGNRLEGFDPQIDFLSLQLLDLANCGLQSLPEDLGQMMPNLRALNLNFNALADIGCLRCIPRLKRLLLAGNRLANSLSVVEVMAEFPYLSEVDLRDNPITQGFYPSLQVLVHGNTADVVDLFRLPDADIERDATYCNRLDLDTRIRRRLYEYVSVERCRWLKKLDGLPLRRDICEVRDSIWKELASRGLVLNKDGTMIDPADYEGVGEQKENRTMEESRWNAEDSFA